ncbi:hypothetical protein PLICRDRAFT_50839 [Plicaturopsis crispa FD-325 SS-3]|nr:hypothetical protein PLICRDRAFT_50839 [Plicaturopsis crispa FD-325 SS-3]
MDAPPLSDARRDERASCLPVLCPCPGLCIGCFSCFQVLSIFRSPHHNLPPHSMHLYVPLPPPSWPNLRFRRSRLTVLVDPIHFMLLQLSHVYPRPHRWRHRSRQPSNWEYGEIGRVKQDSPDCQTLDAVYLHGAMLSFAVPPPHSHRRAAPAS